MADSLSQDNGFNQRNRSIVCGYPTIYYEALTQVKEKVKNRFLQPGNVIQLTEKWKLSYAIKCTISASRGVKYEYELRQILFHNKALPR